MCPIQLLPFFDRLQRKDDVSGLAGNPIRLVILLTDLDRAMACLTYCAIYLSPPDYTAQVCACWYASATSSCDQFWGSPCGHPILRQVMHFDRCAKALHQKHGILEMCLDTIHIFSGFFYFALLLFVKGLGRCVEIGMLFFLFNTHDLIYVAGPSSQTPVKPRVQDMCVGPRNSLCPSTRYLDPVATLDGAFCGLGVFFTSNTLIWCSENYHSCLHGGHSWPCDEEKSCRYSLRGLTWVHRHMHVLITKSFFFWGGGLSPFTL